MPGIPENDAATEPRRIAGRYRLTEPLGRGAMGTVWAGYDEVLHRAVAIKELRVPPGVPAGEMVAMRERMLREARTLGGLSHPNVITLYDVVDVAGDPYVVLELLPSRNLSEVINDQGRLSVGQAASIGLAVAAALQAAHRAGITHRDVKPGNVLVAHDGRIKLTDFGIARKSDDVTMTATGLVLGSPAYIAPEVAAGDPVSPAADLWGLGATLYASVEGRPPYDVDGDPVKTVTAVVHARVPRSTVTGPLAGVIAELMVKDPGRRLPLTGVRSRLRPLLTDPDDPLFPGAPEAFTLPPTSAVPREVAAGGGSDGALGNGGTADGDWAEPADDVADTGGGSTPSTPPPAASPPRTPTPASRQRGRAGAPAAALSADPGPLPGPASWSPTPTPTPAPARGGAPRPGPRPMPSRPPVPRPVPPPPPSSGRGGRLAVPLVLAGALTVAIGAVGGWAGTRVLVGQSPLSTSVVSPVSGNGAVGSLRLYGPGPLGFTALVPAGWEEYRLAGSGDAGVVLFVSTDGARELRFDKLEGSRTRSAQPADFVEGLTAAKLGVARVVVEDRSPNQVRYRTDRVGPQGTSSRVGYAQLTQAGTDVWVVQLIVPADRAGDTSKRLFDSIAAGFRP